MKDAVLWKRILNEGFTGDYVFEDDSNERILSAIIRSTIIVDTRPMDTVSEWDSLSGLAFPFDAFWIEGLVQDENVHESASGLADGAVWGALVETTRGDPALTTTATVFFATNQSRPWLEGAFRFRTINGKPVGTPEGHINDDVGLKRKQLGLSPVVFVAKAGMMITDVLMFLGCKNVSLAPHPIDRAHRRRAERERGPIAGGYRYHTLVVRPPGAKSDASAQEIGIMPRHVCRGHFAEYGPEFGKGLLFGKYAGRFYIPPHLKGKKENGIVEKDYEVRAAP